MKNVIKLAYLKPYENNRAHYSCDIFSENSWWRHQMETFSALLAICAGNSPVSGEFPAQRPVTRSFDVFFDLCPNKRLSKQSWGWWFETQSGSLWRHSNVLSRWDHIQIENHPNHYAVSFLQFGCSHTAPWLSRLMMIVICGEILQGFTLWPTCILCSGCLQ